MIPVLAGIGLGVAAYVVVTAAETVLRVVRERYQRTSSTRGPGCEPADGRSAEPSSPARCWCGGELNGLRTAHFPATTRIYCAECGRWSPVKEPS